MAKQSFATQFYILNKIQIKPTVRMIKKLHMKMKL
jgi:hypothetical protein